MPAASEPPLTQQLSLFDEPTAPEVAGRGGLGTRPALSPSWADVPAPRPPAAPVAPVMAEAWSAPTSQVDGALGPEFRHPRSQRDVVLAGQRVAYALRRSRRRSIGFMVGPEGLSVSAPRWVGLAEIEAALREKGTWILRKLQEQRERSARLEAARVQWSEGGGVPFLGETVIMVLDPRVTGAELRSAPSGLPGVPHLTLHLGLPHTAAPDQIRDVVQAWLQRQARRVFEERCKIFAQRLGVQMTSLSLSSANTRWGSARADGSIRLNWRLIHFGVPVIDYVVTHELAHLREMNHSEAFWEVVRSALPGYEAARGVLRKEILPVLE